MGERKKLCSSAKCTTDNTKAFCVRAVVNFCFGSPMEFERLNCQCFCAACILDGLGPFGPVMKVAEVTSQFWIRLASNKKGTTFVSYFLPQC